MGGIGGWIAEAAKDLRADIYEADRRIRAKRDRLRQDRGRVVDYARFWWLDESKAPISIPGRNGGEIARAFFVSNVGWIAFKRSVNRYNKKGKKSLQKARDKHLEARNWPKGAIVIVTADGRQLMRATDRYHTEFAEPSWGPLRGDVDWERALEWR